MGSAAVQRQDDMPVPPDISGRVVGIRSLIVEITGLSDAVSIGALIELDACDFPAVLCEVVALAGNRAFAIPFGPLCGVRLGSRVRIVADIASLWPSAGWIGRIVDPFGHPLDNGPPLKSGKHPYPLLNDPPPSFRRGLPGAPLDVGVRAINSLFTIRRGQRFAVTGTAEDGIEALMARMARHGAEDVAVIGLVGAGGMGALEKVIETLGPQGLERAVIVVASLAESALTIRLAARATLAVAEYFRDQGQHVLCMMDGLGCLAQAEKTIADRLRAGAFDEGHIQEADAAVQRLVDRAGPGENEGAITGFFGVRVSQDRAHEPMHRLLLSHLDGHIALEEGQVAWPDLPEIDLRLSYSKAMPGACDPAYLPAVRTFCQMIEKYWTLDPQLTDGSYCPGTDSSADRAIAAQKILIKFVHQSKEESTSLGDSYTCLADIVNSLG